MFKTVLLYYNLMMSYITVSKVPGSSMITSLHKSAFLMFEQLRTHCYLFSCCVIVTSNNLLLSTIKEYNNIILPTKE